MHDHLSLPTFRPIARDGISPGQQVARSIFCEPMTACELPALQPSFRLQNHAATFYASLSPQMASKIRPAKPTGSRLLDTYLLSLGLKLLSAALVVIVAALLVEKAGPFIGAMIVTLPISTGPSYVFLAMEHPPDFVAKAALSGLVANAATPIFMATYARLAPRFGLGISLGAALAIWATAVASSTFVPWSLPLAVLANIVMYGIGWEFMRDTREAPKSKSSSKQWWDIPVRALAVMSLCGAVLVTARVIGSHAAGLIALLPLGFTSMALVVHPRAGGAVSASVFANGLPGMIGLVGGLLALNLAVETLGPWVALSAGLAVSVAWNCMLLAVRSIRRR